jgi:hypothetical protein
MMASSNKQKKKRNGMNSIACDNQRIVFFLVGISKKEGYTPCRLIRTEGYVNQ